MPSISQKTADKVIMEFIIDTFKPLSLVDDPSFQKMIKTFSSTTKVICRQTLGNKISTAFTDMTTKLIRDLAFIGVTVLWMDPLTLKRRSAALALRCIIGKQTYDVLAKEIMDIHKTYKIHNKVVKMVTDNGTNLSRHLKLFRENEEDSEDMELINLDDILSVDDSNNPICLPKHQRCCCYNLNLIATKDAEKVMEPLATSLKILEREDNMEQGYLTPVLTILIDRLKKFSRLRYCQPLVECVLSGIDKSFKNGPTLL
ncbi:uncharacterized protein LOC135924678 isoform X2 [Gordionus sp. m RMFG-2023]|uniref:uncharacterized protein LOC135924678 isoform X2 n=2 Tax=Gordionus sp. m RMFG-2023 TaxID=3053472 RepID=UPI0031FD323B